MKKLLIALLLTAVILGTVAASAKKQPDVFSVWTQVELWYGTRPCDNLSNYFEPCRGCLVWIRWPEHVPGTPERPMRLDGYMTDEPGECQVFNVTKYVTCR